MLQTFCQYRVDPVGGDRNIDGDGWSVRLDGAQLAQRRAFHADQNARVLDSGNDQDMRGIAGSVVLLVRH